MPAVQDPPQQETSVQVFDESQVDAQNLNMEIWDSVYETDRKYCQSFTTGRFTGTAIKPMYLVKKATEVFGPIGVGWGFHEVTFKTFNHPKSDDMLWLSFVEVWYRHPDGISPVSAEGGKVFFEREGIGRVRQWGGAKITSTNRRGELFVDDEAPKKAITDGLTKCLSYLGFGADIHMGDTSDSKYLSDDKPPAQARVSHDTQRSSDHDQDKVYDDIVKTINAVTDPAKLIALGNDVSKIPLTPEQRQKVNQRLEERGRELTPDQPAGDDLTE